MNTSAFEPLSSGFQLLQRGTVQLGKIERNGIRIDTEYVNSQMDRLGEKEDYLRNHSLMKFPDIRRWKRKYGRKFNLDSDDQLRDILYTDLGYEPLVETEHGLPAVSQAAIEPLGCEFVPVLLLWRKVTKVRDTFLKNIQQETIDGFLHPFFDLYKVRTYRSSSSSINFQNQPNRDPFMKRLIRKSFIPRPGRMITEFDFKGAEVGTATCYHCDPAMIRYLENHELDLHRDMAMEIYRLPLQSVTKGIRHKGKNQFVFPQFYGDYWASCAVNLWDAPEDVCLSDGLPLRIYLDTEFGSYGQFADHVKNVENKFWHKKFKRYTKWKEQWYADYLKNGYFRIATGFRVEGILPRNQVINYPVQGAAFHFLLWTLCELQDWLEKGNYQSLILGQIHDSIVMDVVPDEMEEIKAQVKWLVEEGLKQRYSWINVPLEVEAEATPVDGSWLTKEEIPL